MAAADLTFDSDEVLPDFERSREALREESIVVQ